MNTKNARFWIWWNDGPVKLTLRPGETLTAHKFNRHEEGWSSETETYTHEGDSVYCEIITDGTDCDGRLRRHWEGYCDIGELKADLPTESDFPIEKHMEKHPMALRIEAELGRDTWWSLPHPKWREKKSWQRDYTAEAMGY